MCEIDITIIFVNKQHCCRCRLKSVVARSTTHLKHCHETKFRCCKLKQQVEVGSTFFNNKICCVIMFEVGDNTCNNAFQFATQQCCVQIAAICCSYYFTLILVVIRPNFDWSFLWGAGDPWGTCPKCPLVNPTLELWSTDWTRDKMWWEP